MTRKAVPPVRVPPKISDREIRSSADDIDWNPVSREAQIAGRRLVDEDPDVQAAIDDLANARRIVRERVGGEVDALASTAGGGLSTRRRLKREIERGMNRAIYDGIRGEETKTGKADEND